MNRKKYLAVIPILLCLIALFSSVTAGASEDVTYTPEQEAIFDTVRELARHQALANLEQDIFGLDTETFEQLKDEEMIALRAEIARLREVLADQGAVPDDKTLAALHLENPFKVDGVRVSNLAQFRKVFCDIFPTLHWIYVKKDTENQWQLALTTHSTAIAEHHDWYYTTIKSGSPQALGDKEKRETTLQPIPYSDRLQSAITAYRMKEHHFAATAQFTPMLDITATTGMTEPDGSDIFYSYAVDIHCPATPNDLAQRIREIETTTRFSDFYNRYRTPIWLASAAILIPVLWLIFNYLERQIRAWNPQR